MDGTSEFVITPYKIYLSVLIKCFVDDTKLFYSSRFKARFAKLIMNLTWSMDSKYSAVRSAITAYGLEKLFVPADRMVWNLQQQGLGSIMELISDLKQTQPNPVQIQKSSILGLFNRRMFLYMDKLSFTALTRLYEEFLAYVQEAPAKAPLARDEMIMDSDEALLQHHHQEDASKWHQCTRQIFYFLAKQVNLIGIDEKSALSPTELFDIIDNVSKEGITSSASQNELNFVRYVNSMRINEYAGAREALIAYFDSCTTNNAKCWAVYNLAALHFHFGHDRLALDTIKECISCAQETTDEKCLEFALLLLAKLMIKKQDRSEKDKELIPLLRHLQTKSSKLDLNNVNAIAGLLQEQVQGPAYKRTFCGGTASSADILCVKHSMNELLMATYASKAALFATIGSVDLSILLSQLLLHMYTVDAVGDELYFHINESSAIGIRNLALYIWRYFGEYESAGDLLISMSQLYSPYKNNINAILKKALAEIEFEQTLMNNKWREAYAAYENIRNYDVREGQLRFAEYYLRQGNKPEAFEIIKELEASGNYSEYFELRIKLMKSKILKNFNMLLETYNKAKEEYFYGIVILCAIEMSEQLFYQLQLPSQAIDVLQQHMVIIMANGTLQNVSQACFNYALCLSKISGELESEEEKNECRRKAVAYNEKAIAKFEIQSDYEKLLRAIHLQANLYNELGNTEKRNFYARKYRLLCKT